MPSTIKMGQKNSGGQILKIIHSRELWLASREHVPKNTLFSIYFSFLI